MNHDLQSGHRAGLLLSFFRAAPKKKNTFLAREGAESQLTLLNSTKRLENHGRNWSDLVHFRCQNRTFFARKPARIARKIRIARKLCSGEHEVHERISTNRNCQRSPWSRHDANLDAIAAISLSVRARNGLEATCRARPTSAVLLRGHDHWRLLPAELCEPSASACERPLLSLSRRGPGRRFSSLQALPSNRACIEWLFGEDSCSY